MSNIYQEYYDLQKKYEECQEAIQGALNQIYCIGGPLNDNMNQYSKEQLMPFVHIASILKSVKEAK